MAEIIHSDDIPQVMSLDARLWVYCGMDCCLTGEIEEKTEPQLSPETRAIYDFEMECLAPALVMMLRGIRVDPERKWELIKTLEKRYNRVRWVLDRLAVEVWEEGLNPHSPLKIMEFFYDRMKIPTVYVFIKGEKKRSSNEEALGKIKNYYWAKPFVNCIREAREIRKKIAVLRSGVDRDNRMRCSFNVGATETGRWSSSKNWRTGGTNLQNITPEMREVFIADEDYLLVYPDLEQAEARVVAYLSRDPAYMEACESKDDLHTAVARMIWPTLPWTGDPQQDRKVAEGSFWRHFSYRDMSKRGGHATNYGATAWTLARVLNVDQKVAWAFQDAYFAAFPGIRRWHLAVQRQLQETAIFTTTLGRRRMFFGRRFDDTTLREAIAYEPQSVVGDLLNQGLLEVWKEQDLGTGGRDFQVLGQVHDAILGQVLEAEAETILSRTLYLMTIPVPFDDREMTIPVDVKVGYNWKDMVSLEKWRAGKISRSRASEDLLSWVM